MNARECVFRVHTYVYIYIYTYWCVFFFWFFFFFPRAFFRLPSRPFVYRRPPAMLEGYAQGGPGHWGSGTAVAGTWRGPHRGSLLATGGGSAESLSSSLKGMNGPSRLQALADTFWKHKDSAKAPCAAQASKLDQRATEAATTAARSRGGAERARARASRRRKSAASGLHRPPSSRARTTKRHRCERNNSG